MRARGLARAIACFIFSARWVSYECGACVANLCCIKIPSCSRDEVQDISSINGRVRGGIKYIRKIRRRWIPLNDVLHKLIHSQIIHCDEEPALTRCLEVVLGISHPICIEEGCRRFGQFEVYICSRGKRVTDCTVGAR